MKFEQLNSIVGMDAALALCAALGGTSISVPRTPVIPETRERVLESFDLGRDPLLIARDLGLRFQQVDQILCEAKIQDWRDRI